MCRGSTYQRYTKLSKTKVEIRTHCKNNKRHDVAMIVDMKELRVQQPSITTKLDKYGICLTV